MSGQGGFRHHTLSESSTCSASSAAMVCPEPPSPAPRPRPPPPSLPLPAVSSRPPQKQGSCSRSCEAAYLLPTRLATALLALLQGGVLDCYLAHYNSTYWFAWIAGDVAVLMMFVVAFVISYRQMSTVMRRLLARPLLAPSSASPQPPPTGGDVGGGEAKGGSCCGGRGVRELSLSLLGLEPWGGGHKGGAMEGEEAGLVPSAGSMPLVYFAWLVYSLLLGVRVLLVYKNFAHQLDQDVFLGRNMLQMTVASTALVFLLLLFAHHDACPDSRRRRRIDALTAFVLFDLIDAADLLNVLADPAARVAMAPWVTWCVLGVACVNLVLPTLPLMALSRTQLGARPLPEHLQTLCRLLGLLGVNGPLLATRLLLWQHVHLAVSGSFLVKNLAVSFLVLYRFYERDHHRRLRDALLLRGDVDVQ